MTLVKICGLRDIDSSMIALESGANMLGFVFAESKRRVDPATVRRILRECRLNFDGVWDAVGVFANQPIALVRELAVGCDLDVIQLSGDEPAEYLALLPGRIIKAVHMAPLVPEPRQGNVAYQSELAALPKGMKRNVRLLLDTGSPGLWGGTGQVFDWKAVRENACDCMIAGGLNPSNVGSVIDTLRPWAVDVSSGVEVDGEKDRWLIKRFISEVRRCDANGF